MEFFAMQPKGFGMENNFSQYTAIMRLIDKYGLVFQSHQEYENYVRDLLEILQL